MGNAAWAEGWLALTGALRLARGDRGVDRVDLVRRSGARVGRADRLAGERVDRPAVEQGVLQLAQQVLNDYKAGVRVVRVELLGATVPPDVIAAFNDVLNANQDAETAVNNANRDSAQIVNEAEACRGRTVREATGEAERFSSVYNEYRLAPQVTRDRIYIETM